MSVDEASVPIIGIEIYQDPYCVIIRESSELIFGTKLDLNNILTR